MEVFEIMPEEKTNQTPPEVDEIITEDEDVEITEHIEEESDEENGSNNELDTLKAELQATQAKADEYLDGWQRARAEFSNYKKRVEREQSQLYKNVTGSVIKRYLGVLDDMERALKNRPADGDGAVWSEGIDLIYRKLLNFLENEGVTQMQAEGQDFDPMLHEAVSSEENDQYESGQIIEVIQQGYMIGDKVLRPAMVRVAR
jgi:molecular chaperone GrpE